MNPLKILLADDHEKFRQLLYIFLKSQQNIEIVGQAANGKDAVEQAASLHPDVVLMDIHMPEQNGIEATKAIKNRWPDTRVFILSMDPAEYYKNQNLTPADGFIPKASMKNSLVSMLTNEQSRMAMIPAGIAAA